MHYRGYPIDAISDVADSAEIAKNNLLIHMLALYNT